MNFDRGNVIRSQVIAGLYIGAAVVKQGKSGDTAVGMGYYTWKNWTLPTYHERLKKSYPLVRQVFQELSEKETVKEKAR